MKKSRTIVFWSVVALLFLLGVTRIPDWPTQSARAPRSPVVISEFMAINNAALADEQGSHVDWIELHNRSGREVNLLGWSLTDDLTRPDKWVFPEIVLPAGEYLVVFASGRAQDRAVEQEEDGGEQSALHASFRLNGGGGTLALFDNTSRRFLDAFPVDYPAQIADKSYGLCGEMTYCFFDAPTPGGPNAEPNRSIQGHSNVEAPLTFSLPHGLYDESFDLKLGSDIDGATILYTLDGSEPGQERGSVYDGPIAITGTTVVRATVLAADAHPYRSLTQTYIFPADVLAQPADPPGFPATWGTHRIDFAHHRAGDPVIGDYEMDPEVVGEPGAAEAIDEALGALPTLSLVTDIEQFDIYFNDPQMRGPESERPVSVEWIEPDGGAGFQINAGVRIQGGVSRWEYMPKHSFRLFFRQKYGSGALEYDLFGGGATESFNTLILRGGANRSFAGEPPENVHNTVYTRDEWARASQLAMSGIASHGTFVHLYLNGLYWGLYNVVERPDVSFLTSYLGGDADEWFSASHDGPGSGQPDRFAVMLQLAQQGGLADPGKYATMLEFVDPEQFSDYVILNWYAGTTDWPEHNWYAGVRYPAGRNLFFVWDAEESWNGGASTRLGTDGYEGWPYPNVTKFVFLALAENPEFRLLFADRLYTHLFNDGALTEASAQARWRELTSLIEPAIIAESARWGDVWREEPLGPETWTAAREDVLGQMQGNSERLIALARAEGYYPDLDPPVWNQHGGHFEGQLDLTMTAPDGEIFYTLDGSDPRQMEAIRYTAPVQLTTQTTVKARLKQGEVWSALREAIFTRSDQRPQLCISEIMYNPLGGGDYEFLEISNVGDAQLDLGFGHIEGIDFHFPAGYVMQPGETQVLIRDFFAFRERYPVTPIRGIYRGNLANEGETITLYDRWGNALESVSYDDENGWPLSADGLGDSLVRLDCDGPANDPQSWDVSEDVHGSPAHFVPQPSSAPARQP